MSKTSTPSPAEKIAGIISAYGSLLIDATATAAAIVRTVGHDADLADLLAPHIESVTRDDKALGNAILSAVKEARAAASAVQKTEAAFKFELLPDKSPYPTMLRFSGAGKPKNLSGSFIRQIIAHSAAILPMIEAGDNR